MKWSCKVYFLFITFKIATILLSLPYEIPDAGATELCSEGLCSVGGLQESLLMSRIRIWDKKGSLSITN
jgi:hypothetical protein